MDPIEISIYILATILVGTLTLGLFTGWDYMKPYQALKDGLMGKQKQEFESVPESRVPSKVMAFWEESNKREGARSVTIHITGEGMYTKEEFFNTMKDVGLCGSIQSHSEDCGEGETFTRFDDVTLPGLARINYENHTLALEALS